MTGDDQEARDDAFAFLCPLCGDHSPVAEAVKIEDPGVCCTGCADAIERVRGDPELRLVAVERQ